MKHKGFTLSELMVALAVSGVVLVSVFTMVVAVSSFYRVRTEQAAIQQELLLTKNRLNDWFSLGDRADADGPVVSAGGEWLSFDGRTAHFDGEAGALVLDDTRHSTGYIEHIAFAQEESNPNLIKCTVTYRGQNTSGTYVFLLLKRSGNP